MKQAEINIGMVGHVDHGKTTLTEAISGKWTDTYSEEIKRGISIRLGYADVEIYYCDKCKKRYTNKKLCPICGKKGKLERIISLVDAPGHETLMTTMLSGAAIMDAAILVIAANEKCPQPQTKEHLLAIKIAGIKKIIVAQTKIDLVSEEKALENKKEIEKFLAEYGYSAPIIPLVAPLNINIDVLLDTIEKEFKTPKRDLKKPVRMYAIRSFDINKPGTKIKDLKGGVIGGAILHGEVKEGDLLEIVPGLNEDITEIKVISLSTGHGKLKKAIAGGLIAIGTKIDPGITQGDRLKGVLLGKKGTLNPPKSLIELEYHDLGRTEELRTNETIVVTIGALVTTALITEYTKNKIKISARHKVSVEKGQKIAISKRTGNRWALAGYGVVI